MGRRVAKTDENGEFSVNYFGFNRALADKSALLSTFKPGFISEASSREITSSLFALYPKPTEIAALRGPGDQYTSTSATYKAASELPAPELGASDELLNTLHFSASLGCSETYSEANRHAFEHALSIAVTFDERMRVGSTCRGVRTQLATNPHSDPWPFDCENLTFKHTPSTEALAVEAKIQAAEDARGVASE